MMKRYSYRLARQDSGTSFFAEVDLVVDYPTSNSCASEPITVSHKAFHWIKSIYGAHAWEWKDCDKYREEAIYGVDYALRQTKRNIDEYHVIISKIEVHPAHTAEGSVAFAACMATCQALNIQLERYPVIHGGKVIFE
jgi:hypothetical protein